MLSVLDIIIRYKEALLKGLFVTMQLCLVIWAVGIVIGILLGYLGSKFKDGVGVSSRITSFILGGIPVLVILFWMHYPLQTMLQISINPFWVACLALSLINIFAVSDLTRNALINFPEEYSLAAKVCGISTKDIFLRIEFPIIFRQIVPNLLNIQVNMLQLTLFASFISVEEIFRIAQQINAAIYQPVQIYSTLAVFFLIVCLPLNGLAMYLKKKYTRNLSEK